MQKINSSAGLREAILLLESQQAEEGRAMKACFHLTYESVKPINLIKSTFREVAESPDISSNIISTVAGLATGYLSKTLVVGASNNPWKKLLGTVLMFSVTNLIAKHPEAIKSVGNGQ